MALSSVGRFRRRGKLSFSELAVCVASPVLALFLRGVEIDHVGIFSPWVIYVTGAAVGGFLAIQNVQLSQSPSGFVSVRDLVKIFKAALAASISGVVAVYFSTHMQVLPRYVPIIHLFLFSGFLTGLTLWRTQSRSVAAKSQTMPSSMGDAVEYQLLIGCGPLSVHYTALIDAMPGANKKIAGIVSICGDLVGAMLAGRTVLGPIEHILEIFSEFENHGIKIGRVVISTLNESDQKLAIDAVTEYCTEHAIPISLLSDLILSASIPAATTTSQLSKTLLDDDTREATNLSEIVNVPQNISRYLVVRQRFDWILALIVAVLISPLLIGIALLTYVDVGRPVIFWQTRIGRFRQLVTIHKFRTLPHRGENPVSTVRQPSIIGQFLQSTRLDELPQIFDVLERHLSFIGPRPLLPQDLPIQTGYREKVLPGITGWAQIHGGKHVTTEEKIALDHWYLQHATPRIDLYILFKTCLVAFPGYEKRDERVIADAMHEFYDQAVGGLTTSIEQISVHPDAERSGSRNSESSDRLLKETHAA